MITMMNKSLGTASSGEQLLCKLSLGGKENVESETEIFTPGIIYSLTHITLEGCFHNGYYLFISNTCNV